MTDRSCAGCGRAFQTDGMDPVTSDYAGDYCTVGCRAGARARRAMTGGRRVTPAAARVADDRAVATAMAEG
jgi:hypothetical protein